MPSKKPAIPKPPTPWAKKRKVSSPLQQPVVAKSAKKPTQTPVASLKDAASHIAKTDPPNDQPKVEEITSKVTALPLSSNAPTSPAQRKPLLIVGRRPDYKHQLVGLQIGDQIVFHKNPQLVAEIVDLDNKVMFDGTEYDGIVPAAEKAYQLSGLTPPKRVTGLSEWRDPNGIRLRVLYEKIMPYAPQLSVQPSQPKVVNA